MKQLSFPHAGCSPFCRSCRVKFRNLICKDTRQLVIAAVWLPLIWAPIQRANANTLFQGFDKTANSYETAQTTLDGWAELEPIPLQFVFDAPGQHTIQIAFDHRSNDGKRAGVQNLTGWSGTGLTIV